MGANYISCGVGQGKQGKHIVIIVRPAYICMYVAQARSGGWGDGSARGYDV